MSSLWRWKMEEGAEGSYEYAGTMYRLGEAESQRWSVFDGETFLGAVFADPILNVEGARYSIDLAGEQGTVGEPFTDDWRRAVETLINLATGAEGD